LCASRWPGGFACLRCTCGVNERARGPASRTATKLSRRSLESARGTARDNPEVLVIGE
jgi:hypothetical protein